MGYEKLRVAKPMKQLIRVLEIYSRHITKENRGEWRDAKMLSYKCFGNLIRAAEVWDSKEKDGYLLRFLEDFAVFRGMMQVFTEIKMIPVKKASEIGLLTADIKTQISGWRKEIERGPVSPRPNG